MTGAEFRALRAAAGLSVRRAAEALDVAPSTIQRWQMDDAAVSAAAAARIRELAGDRDPAVAAVTTLGRLYAVLERVTGRNIPPSTLTLLRARPSAATGQLFALARRRRPERYRLAEPEIEELVGDIAAYPDIMTPALDGAFWLGYYKRRGEYRSGVAPEVERDAAD